MLVNLKTKLRGLGTLQFRAVVFSLFVGCLAAGFSELGFFRVPNHLLFDLAVAQAEPANPKVILVRAEPTEVAELLSYFRDQGTQRVILTGINSKIPAVGVDVVLGITPAVIPGTDRWSLPASVDAINSGADVVPLNQGFIARSFVAWLPGKSSRLPTIEGKILGSIDRGAERLISLNPESEVPVLNAQQILGGQLPPNTLKRMYVVVGPPASIDPKRFLTSSLSSTARVSSSEFHARAVQAILTGRTVFQPEGSLRAAILILASLILMVSLRIISPQHRLASAALAATLLFATGMAFITTLGVYLPIAGLVIISIVQGLACEFEIADQRRQRTGELLNRATLQIQQTFPLETSRWVDFFSIAAKLAGVENSLLVQEQDDGTFVSLAAFGQPPSGGIENLRRSGDFDRADSVSPVPVPITNLVRTEGSFLVRLGLHDSVRVYWLYMLPASCDELAQVNAAAARLAKHTSENIRWFRYSKFRRTRAEAIRRRTDRAINGLVRRADELHRSLTSLQTATLLFDPSGMPITVNESMKRLVGQCGLQLSRMTPADFATALTGIDADAIRSKLGQLVRHGGQTRLNSQLKIFGRNYTLRVTDLDGDLLFEATDITSQTRLNNLQSELASEIDAKLRNDLEAIGLALRLAEDERLTSEQRARALRLVRVAADRTRANLDNLALLADSTRFLEELSIFPVCPRAVLGGAVAKVTPLAKRSGVDFTIVQPALASLVLAEPEMLEDLLEAILQVVVSDSGRMSAIEIMISEEDEATFVIVKGGFGLPSVWLEAHLYDERQEAAQPFLIIRQVQKQLKSWGATLSAFSETGEGYRFTLELKRT